MTKERDRIRDEIIKSEQRRAERNNRRDYDTKSKLQRRSLNSSQPSIFDDIL